MTDETPTDIPTATVSLRPEAIVEYELPRAKRGYDRDAVDDLLDRLAAQTTELLREVEALRQDRRSLLARLEESSETESTLKRTLLTAQRAAELSVSEAEEQADAIRTRALERAEELLARAADQAHELREAALRRARADEAEARRRRRGLEEHVDQLRAFAEDHHERVAHHLRQQLERLDAMEVPPPPPEPPAAADPILDEPRLERDVDDLVAELADEVGTDAAPPTGAPPEAADGPWTSAVPPLSPPGAGGRGESGGPEVDDEPRGDEARDVDHEHDVDDEHDDGGTTGADLDQLLARIDEAAAEVADTHEQVGSVDPSGDGDDDRLFGEADTSGSHDQ